MAHHNTTLDGPFFSLVLAEKCGSQFSALSGDVPVQKPQERSNAWPFRLVTLL